ncbi:hypothetical protein [Butyricimonas paravirosa]|uniref:hypothetical protein n=1 Tax=Butyricimonas paravirosa TaxID=1472417 RepID=UPI002A7F3642|nr:hypothetical protein [Butyricimonas paravirosa]
MKRVFILLVIQIIFLGVLSAQKMTRSSEYDFYAKKKLWGRLFLDSVRLKEQKEIYFSFSRDSTLKLVSAKDIFTRGDSIYLNKLTLNKFDVNLDLFPRVDFKYTLPVKPLLYISLLDYSSKPVLDRYSHFYNPFDRNRNSRDLKYLWSGGATNFKETGYSGNFTNHTKPMYLLHLVRDGNKIKGFALELLDDDDW